MWNKNKSLRLTLVCTKIVIACIFILAVSLPFLYRYALLDGDFYFKVSLLPLIAIIFYACCIVAVIALIMLDKMLSNIKEDLIFTDANVRYLRIISWCCFLAAAILLVGSFADLVFWVTSVMAAFIGLILRVVKNVFEAAVALKAENDFTI